MECDRKLLGLKMVAFLLHRRAKVKTEVILTHYTLINLWIPKSLVNFLMQLRTQIKHHLRTH